MLARSRSILACFLVLFGTLARMAAADVQFLFIVWFFSGLLAQHHHL